VLFLATASGYAFFQVPYVAMLAGMTESYDERTRLMTWRVDVLGVAILISGAVAPIAAAYAVLRHIGDDGYLALASSAMQPVRGLAAVVSTVDGLALLVEPLSTVVAFRSTDPALDLFVLGDELAARGLHAQTQFAHGGIPASIHPWVTASVAPRVAEFATALAEAAAAAPTAGPVEVPPLDLGELTPELVASLAAELGLAGASGGSGPPRMAAVNVILAAAPLRMREWLLEEFLSLLQSNAA
jgi:hypothetical protein